MALSSPHSLAATYLLELFHHFPGVRDGDPESVHQARVATRRLREVVPLTRDGHATDIDEALSLLRSIGWMSCLNRREEESVPILLSALT